MKHARGDYNRIQDPLTEHEGGIPQDEPVFLLRAQDENAPATLRYWADRAEMYGADYRIAEAGK